MARLKEYYSKEVAPALMSKFSYKSTMQIPKLDKIVINVGAGEAKDNSKVIDAICTDLSAITGQKPLICKARKSVANFKLREGMAIGCKVTLRGERMYEFLDMQHFPVFVTSEVSTLIHLTAVVTTTWASKNSSSSPRLTMTRSTRFVVWTFVS